MKQVLIAAPISENFRKFLIDSACELVYFEAAKLQPFNLLGVEGIITSNKLLLNQSELEKYPALRWIARLGSGMEIIDTKYCDEKGIQYFSSPEGISNSVAEHVTGMLLCLLHKITSSHNEIQNGHWIREANRGSELSDLTVGIIGFGHTGSKTAQKLAAFTSQVMVYDKYQSGFSARNFTVASLEQIQKNADIISFHVPLNDETRHYYNADFLSHMRKNHIVLNASRGGVVQTSVVLSGLQSGKITGACLDVLEEEPDIAGILRHDNNIVQQLLRHPVILTPHIAGYSMNAIKKMCDELMFQLKEIL